MNKHILILPIVAALSGCEIDNSAAKKVPANFNNEFATQVGFDGSQDKGLEVPLTFGHGSASGFIKVTDVNFGEADPDYTLVPEATYGTFVMTEEGDGEWTYDLDETHPDVLALKGNPSATLTDTVTLTSLDGTTGQINFVISGTPAESPAEFRGAFVANVSLTDTLGFGRAEVYDQNFQESFFRNEVQAKFGTFTIQPDGRWEYQLDKRHPDLQSLITPEDKTEETFIVTSTDGSEVEFKVNITGAPLNFAAQIPGSTEQDSLLSINFINGGIPRSDTSDGKIVFNAKVTEDISREAEFAFGCTRWNTESRRLSSFWIKPDGMFEMWSAEINPGGSYSNGAADYARANGGTGNIITKRVTFDQFFTPGEWSEVELSWEQAAIRPRMTLKIDGVNVSSDHGAIPADPSEKFLAQTLAGASIFGCNAQMRILMKKDADNGGTGAMLIDDIKYFTDIDADVKFDTPAYEERFANNEDGDSIQESSNVNYYKALTTDNILVVRDL